MQKSINGATYRKMILAGASILEENKKYVDSLNVFPVPDGDTGTNMTLTLKSAVKEVNNCTNNNIDSISDALTKGALRGARGNSGVILSQILKGISSVFAEEKKIDTKTFAKALAKGSEIAYKAVTKPKEGTILTVIRMMAESANKIAKKTTDLEDFMKQVLDTGDSALRMTPELLPVLKKAGVVDSGGQGLMIMLAGWYKVLINDESLQIHIEEVAPTIDSVTPNAEVNYENLADIEFAYCTEFMIIEMKKKTTMADIDKLREKLMEIGDSVICIGDLNLVKIHVHTNTPNKAMGWALELGELNNIKIENMLEENRELKRQRKQKEANLKTFGMVSVAAGDGLSAIFKDLGVDYVIEGGQTMNPSADDIAKAIENVNAKNVFVFPNNKNIILAAEQSKDLVKNKNIVVIPTCNVPQGISSAFAFLPEASLEENIASMNEGMKAPKAGSVTYAVRKTHINGFDLNVGDIIGLDEKNIIAKDVTPSVVVKKMIEKMQNEDVYNISLFYGKDVTSEEANALAEELQEQYPDKEITAIYGGQPVYYYIISLE